MQILSARAPKRRTDRRESLSSRISRARHSVTDSCLCRQPPSSTSSSKRTPSGARRRHERSRRL
nr:MAG: hypothetical protein [Molluscum contagiosum virus]